MLDKTKATDIDPDPLTDTGRWRVMLDEAMQEQRKAFRADMRAIVKDELKLLWRHARHAFLKVFSNGAGIFRDEE